MSEKVTFGRVQYGSDCDDVLIYIDGEYSGLMSRAHGCGGEWYTHGDESLYLYDTDLGNTLGSAKKSINKMVRERTDSVAEVR